MGIMKSKNFARSPCFSNISSFIACNTSTKVQTTYLQNHLSISIRLAFVYLALTKNHKIDYFIDINPQKDKTIFLGRPVYSPYQLLQDNDINSIVIIATMYFRNVLAQLEKLNFIGRVFSVFHSTYPLSPLGRGNHEGLLKNINQLNSILADDKSKTIANTILHKRQTRDIDYDDLYEGNQYFISDLIRKDNDAVFIDGGAFNTDTVDQFIKFQNGQFKKIYSFEMDIINYTKIDQSKYDERVQFLMRTPQAPLLEKQEI